MKYVVFSAICTIVLLTSCNTHKFEHDASGTFEATEILISAEVSGLIKQLDVEEGQQLEAGVQVGYIDTVQIYLKKLQLLSSQKALKVSRPDVNKQLVALYEEIARLETEKKRVENLLKGDAATQQQLDNLNAQLKVAEGQLAAQSNSLQTNISNLNEQSAAVDIQIAQIDDQMAKCRIINPVKGTVLNKYAQAHELSAPALPLYKIADLETLFLRAYVTANQFTQIKIGQEVTVYADFGEEDQKQYSGKITWISDKAEFTPKTIQTRNERANLVYAVKIAVKNDGYLKIGMYGDVNFFK